MKSLFVLIGVCVLMSIGVMYLAAAKTPDEKAAQIDPVMMMAPPNCDHLITFSTCANPAGIAELAFCESCLQCAIHPSTCSWANTCDEGYEQCLFVCLLTMLECTEWDEDDLEECEDECFAQALNCGRGHGCGEQPG